MERLWRSYKTKPFILLGSHVSGDATAEAVERVIAEHSLSYPVYRSVELADGAPISDKIPYYYVVDASGKVVFRGSNERLAESALVNALTNLASPPNVRYWRRLIDFEVDVLPGRAYLHLNEFRRQFPVEAKDYDDIFNRLKKDPVVIRLARLEEFSRQAKDFDPRAKPHDVQRMLHKISRTVKAYETLKEGDDPCRVQEAKNCLAELLWAQAALKARLER
jgi:hypothetical protein